MTSFSEYELQHFTPFLLNIAAEETGKAFQKHYKQQYGMLRTEWRVLFHLGQYGPLYAKDICERARLHKTKVSRAVVALEKKRYLSRSKTEKDRRHEILSLTRKGDEVFKSLRKAARQFDLDLMKNFSEEEQEVLKRCLTKMADF